METETNEGLEETPTPVEQETPALDAPAIDSGTSEPSPEQVLDAPFNLEDVDETYRSDVERYAKQLQGAYTRKTQTLADQKREVQALEELKGNLYSDDPERREEALGKLLGDLGYEFAGQDNEEVAVDDDIYVDPVDELRSRLDARDAADASAQADAQSAAEVQRQVAFAESALAKLEETETLSETAKTAIVTYAGSLPRTDDGLPNMEGAIKLWESDRAEAVEGYLRTKRDAEPAPDVSGQTGTTQINLSDRASRLKAAEAAAERAISSHA